MAPGRAILVTKVISAKTAFPSKELAYPRVKRMSVACEDGAWLPPCSNAEAEKREPNKAILKNLRRNIKEVS